MADTKVQIVISAIDRASGVFRKVGAEADRMGKMGADGRMRDARGKFMAGAGAAGPGGSVGMLGLSGGMIGGIGGAFIAKDVIQQAADFETALTNIQKKAGTTAAQTRALGEGIKDMATSGEVAASIDEIAAGYERGAAAGIPLAELRQFGLLSAKAADAFEMSAADVGNAAAGFKTVLKIPMNEMQRYFDLINGLADSGIADESAIVNFIDRAGAMSKTFGLTADQTAALGASLLNLKVPAEVGATAVNSIFTKLLAPGSLSEKGYASLTKLVGPVKAFGKAIDKDAQGTFIKLLDTLKGMSKGARTEAIANIFGQEHLDTMLQMVEGSDEIKRNVAYAAGSDWFGSLDKSYALKLQTMNAQWQIFKNQVSELAIDVGTAGMPLLMGTLQTVKGLVDDIGKGFEGFKGALDMPGITQAGQALSDLQTKLGLFLNSDPSQSAIGKFFQEMAQAVNQIASGINAIDQHFNRPEDAMVPTDQLTPEQQEMRRKYMSRFMPDAYERLQNKESGVPNLAGGKGGAVGASRFDSGRFGDAQAAAGVIGDVGTPTATPPSLMLDNADFMSKAATAQEARRQLEAPIQSVADLNIAPALAKIETLRAAIAGVSAMSVTVGGGNVNGEVRNQFAPVGPG